MSELKAYLCEKVSEIDSKEFLCYKFKYVTIPCLKASMEEVYLKSEVDDVIADKDEKIAELEMKVARAQHVLRLNEPEALFSDLEIMGRLRHKIDVVERRERHQKYKRCLAMAEWCNSEMGRETFACFRPRHTKEVWREEHKYWAKWRKIWFELYKKLKPNNSQPSRAKETK